MKQNIVRHRPTRRAKRFSQEIILSLVVFLVAFVPTVLFAQLDHANELRIWFFDVGQGDATFIETPGGQQILIDGGRDKTVLSKLSSVMWPWDREIDAVVITHADADHITGLVEVFERYEVKTVFDTGVRGSSATAKELMRMIDEEGVRRSVVSAGDVLSFGDVEVRVLWPTQEYQHANQKDRNNLSVVTEVLFGQTSVLLTGDAEQEVETRLHASVSDIDVLKAGHHGSITSSTVPFLQQTRPEVAITSSGENNRYGHPHPVVLSRLRDLGAQVYRTDFDGDILLTSDGGEPSVAPHPLPF